ncbi:MAG: prenyltransferase [Nitrosopumilaceae archaeon]|nr:prenyltransferase [Nitrosopumilaceae archaeon]NIT99536.1 prenyltransferase [Nitrosopumilaceae archaeon]NIU85911.1 prenyltransferase [Nitrosopumilaceae archaeon]NIV64745.1 prenyltransferase [Nitrosopumilaceae archaeon]NIX60139.1 prenyltransferase [Nitrosopumilaceae archaeon]
MSLSVWLRVIRVRFLLASVIAVSVGLSLNWWETSSFDLINAIFVMGGVVALHASIDLLNDYWDFKRGIDTRTKRTKFSGGTGVLPEGLLNPFSVYKAGMIFLIIGSVIGVYLVLVNGLVIAVLLTFAIVSIYFYSTKIVDSGLAEVFVTIKGIVIVLGTYYIQAGLLTTSSLLAGVSVGVLSSFVLFITSFPDYDADKSRGRKTLIIVLGRKLSTNIYWIFPIINYCIIVLGIMTQNFPNLSIITFATIPILIHAGKELKSGYNNLEKLTTIMKSTLLFSRLTGTLLVLSFLFANLVT